MATNDMLDWLRGLLGEQGITLVLVVSARWHRSGDRREVSAREVRDGLELEAADPGTAQEVTAALESEPQIKVTRSGDHIHVAVR